MSDCLNALRAIDETWRGVGDPYRQRTGGATIEAINELRTHIELVVFIYVPSHAGVVPNAYADGVAKAYLHRSHRLRIGQLVARLVRSRSVLYEKRGRGGSQMKDGRAFQHVRHGLMEWVRTRSRSAYRGDDGRQWNQAVMSTVGRGPKPPNEDVDNPGVHLTPDDARAHARYAKQRMRITYEYRTGLIAGGPQGEVPMIGAAKVKGSFAASALAGGCRGCHARKEWPGPVESTAHAMHDCAGREVRDLVTWRGDVVKRLKYMLVYVRRIGSNATTLRTQIQQALSAMCQRHPAGARYEALRHTVGGALAWWDDDHEALDTAHNKTLAPMIVSIQNLFIERLNEWTTFMAPSGWRRQSRWKQRDWAKLVLMTMKRHAVGRRATRYARRRALRRIGAKLIYLMRDDESRWAGEQRKEVRQRQRVAARRRIRRILWDIYIRGAKRARVRSVVEQVRATRVGAVERWVDQVHYMWGSRGHGHITLTL